MAINNSFTQYLNLRKKIDNRSSELEQLHSSEMQCKAGCDSCCESISVFPIEFFFIQQEINNIELPDYKLKHRFTSKCRFLVNGRCVIYNSRPIICRTQGLPLLYENTTGKAYELSVCKLNFTETNISSFNMENALFMPPYNSKLFLINKLFVETELNSKYSPYDRIKLNKLKIL